MNWPVWHWHIENSSICSLRCPRCPRCPRAEIPDSLVQTSLGVEFFKRNFDMDMLSDVWQISFCGDDGDPIYGKEFLETVEYPKSAKPKLSLRIVTNGSHRPEAWWQRLSSALNSYDEIHFSIDGWDQESNSLYRVNCDWDSIKSGAKIVRENSTVLMAWAAIVFDFNYSKMDYMSYLAEAAGFDRFQMTLSTKFGSVYPNYLTDGKDLLEPPSRYIPKGHRFERNTLHLTQRTLSDNGKNKINDDIWNNVNKSNEIIPMCKIGNKGLYISSQGYFYPCCWMANRYNHLRWQQFRNDAYDLNRRSIADVLNDPIWEDFYDNLSNHSECVNKCSAHNYNKEYATSW